MVEFNLSEKMYGKLLKLSGQQYFLKRDVKEFIRLLKEEYLKLGTRVLNNKSDQDVLDLIDKLVGDELI